jgi:uncharacterized protein YndB with AHSA1/START domain
VDEDAFSVSRTITIAAPQEKVWQAVTDPEHIVKWFGSGATLDRLAPGGTGVWTFDGYGDVPIMVEAVHPMDSITYRWGDTTSPTIDPAASTVFTLTLTPIAGGTQLHVIETGFETLANPARQMSDNQGGWTSELDKLVALLGGAVVEAAS